MVDSDLVITCPRHFEEDAADEMRRVLEEMGRDEPHIKRSYLPGILMVVSGGDPASVSRRIREKIHDEPWTIRYILRAIPVQSWVDTDVRGIVDASRLLARGIAEGEQYRITIEKRDSDVSSREIIGGIAESIDRKVSLESPDRIVLVEIFGERTGLALLYDGDILSSEKERRTLPE
ncbi:RNA-binding protein [Cenarchaeum symbiosum A]|uniref:RNA-binding protein n=1 Tax=Cenarchaeum symbiosum (strain A) TaxID=414004 RepID=A0RXE0_CENSY|nr:RNA-binding protein [Cenarchaeum symbiosum A]